MIKKTLTLFVACAFGLCSLYAQDFTFLHGNPIQDTTQGVTIFQSGDPSHDNVQISNYLTNVSDTTYKVTWRFISVDSSITDSTLAPGQWFVTGICDNINCRGEFGSWFYGTPQNSDSIAPQGTCLMEMNIYAPTSSPDTTEIFKVEFSSPNQTDTGIYILTKVHGTRISAVQLKNNSVSIFPNPLTLGEKLNLFVNKNLNANRASVYNMIGQRKMDLHLNSKSELTTINVNNLPAGVYIINVSNRLGQTISSLKFIKKQ